ncbi:MAG: phosphate ABC transporter ATP-binding protein [Pseudomonadota bacterium]
MPTPDVVPINAPRSKEPSGPPILGEIIGLTYEADGTHLLRDVDLALSATSRTVIIGPNGAGKSLLLRVLHGLVAPSTGEVRWSGRPMDGASRRQQAMVFQRPILLRRSVAANLRFVLRERGHDANDEVHRLLEEVGLAEFAKRPARLLSVGEQQRLALARALATRPRVLFLDEPTASLDPSATATIETMVQQAHQGGTKIVLVTHNLSQARRLADDVVFLHHGRVIEHTPGPRFFARPTTDLAREFLNEQLLR